MKRNSFSLPIHAHYLTFSCYKRQQLLTDDTLCRQLLICWDDARHQGDFAIWAYVIMPEHVHLVIWPRNAAYQMSSIQRLLKEPFSRWVVKHWGASSSDKLGRIQVSRGTRTVHRFWQEGGGYDRNLIKWEKIDRAVNYVEWNPVRRGLVEVPAAWRWSSASHGSGGGDVQLVVDPIDVSGFC